MSTVVEPQKVINGTFGKLKIDGNLCAEVTGLEAKVTIEKEEVKRVGTLAKGFKVVGTEGKGTIKLNKVYSRFINMMNENTKAGKSTVCTIESSLEDPESDSPEIVELRGCIFDELTLADWEAKKLLDESIPFTFTDYDIIQTNDEPIITD